MVMIANQRDYLQNLASLVSAEDWDAAHDAAKLLSAREDHAECEELQQKEANALALRRELDVPFDGLVALHMRVLYYMSVGSYEDAYKTHTQLVQVFIKEVLQRRKDENWFLPICFRLCSDLRLLAKAADLKPSRTRPPEQSSYYEQSASGIMDRASVDQSKKVAILNLTNQLFRIYFRINKLNLLKPLIRAIENSGTLYQMFSMSEKVTYKYYIGRKAMFDSDLTTAEQALSYAFRNCPSDCARNKRLILMYLIPVKMFLGHMPSERLLEMYNLMQFSDVARSVREGNLLRLDKTLADHEHFFIACGIFLMLEKVRIITYRTLFKKVAKILGTHQVPLEAFLISLRFLNVDDVDADEVACIVANLIYQGKIKGYISHQHQKLVISKQNPFPALSSVSSAVAT
uniref:PCI domain-containing protein 2 homolog n=1 Tax=Plectus sambesii TaxID=2011161 RepID=A0A914WLA5_9BILA